MTPRPEPLSPELALVDPLLAALARSFLTDPPDCLAPRPRPAGPDPELVALEGVVEGAVQRAAHAFVAAPSGADQSWLDRLRESQLATPELERRPRGKSRLRALGAAAGFAALGVAGLVAGSQTWHALRPAPSQRAVLVGPTPDATLPATTAAHVQAALTPHAASSPVTKPAAKSAAPRSRTHAAPAPRRTPASHDRARKAAATRTPKVHPRVHMFVWPAVSSARFYRLELFRAGTRVLDATPREPRFALHRRWRYHGRTIALTSGVYVWIVRPATGRPPAVRYGRPVTHSRWTVRTNT